MYPFLTKNGPELRKELQSRKIYVSMLWGRETQPEGTSRFLANNILPIICDQRYGAGDMDYEVKVLKELLAG